MIKRNIFFNNLKSPNFNAFLSNVSFSLFLDFRQLRKEIPILKRDREEKTSQTTENQTLKRMVPNWLRLRCYLIDHQSEFTMKKYIVTLALIATFFLGSCAGNYEQAKSISYLLTAHKWQLVEETGLNLPKGALGDNIIELSHEGELIYYNDAEKVTRFTKNKWFLSKDEKKIIEIYPDESEIETEIVSIDNQTLKLKYLELNGNGEPVTVLTTYRKFEQNPKN